MHRIDTSTAQRDKFGQGKNGFTRGNPQTGTPATQLDYLYCDAIQEEIANAIESAGIKLDKSKHDQLATAIKEFVKKGSVKLNSSTNSTSETEAATPLAIKNVNDNAVPKSRKINGKKLDADVILTATDVGALSKLDYSYDINDSMTVLRRADGLIIQKFTANYNENHGETGTVVSLPVTFPTVFYFAIAGDAYSGCHTTSAIPNSNSSVRIWGKTGNNYTQSSVQIVAIGR